MERFEPVPREPPRLFDLATGEAALAAAWEQHRYGVLFDDAGRPLQVVFPGRRWGGPGPDFRGALLAEENGTLVRGDVEVHRRSSGWRLHGHAANPMYRDVVLHVVAVADEPTFGNCGARVATVVLEASRAAVGRADPPCRRSAEEIAGIVGRAGRQRLLARATRFEGDIAAVGADQAAWRGLAEALGYAENAPEMARLADVVPWATANGVARELGAVALTALLLGAAGLLGWATVDELDWWPRVAPLAAGGPSEVRWHLAAVRPGNHPARRCRGLANVAAHAAEAGSIAGYVVDVVAAQSGRRWPKIWPSFHARPWIGRGRAQTIAVNVALPFALAAGWAGASDLYERLPGEPWSRPLRYMAALLGRPGLRFRSACERQGLLQIFKVACASRQCANCPAANAWALDERDALPLVRRGQGASASAADDAAARNARAAF